MHRYEQRTNGRCVARVGFPLGIEIGGLLSEYINLEHWAEDIQYSNVVAYLCSSASIVASV